MILPRSKVEAYHCSCCGGTCDPAKGICGYCEQKLTQRFDVAKGFRMKLGDQYLKNMVNLSGLDLTAPTIEVTTLEDISVHYVHGMKYDVLKFSAQFYLTDHMRRQMEFFSNGVEKISLEYLSPDAEKDVAFDLDARYASDSVEHHVNQISVVTLDFVVEEYIGMNRIAVPPGLCCPNCGAPVTSRYGLCDYCGGWIQWIA